MKVRVISTMVMAASFLAGCKDKAASEGPESGGFAKPPVVRADAQTTDGGVATRENIDASEQAAAAKLQPAKDPVQELISAAKMKTRQAYNHRRFDELEAEAAQLRASKETYGNGSWKIVQFYEALAPRDEEPENMWVLHDTIHQEWIAAQPMSVTARAAYVDFLTDYAWQARGTSYADKVTPEGWRLFGERLAAAEKVFEEALDLEEKDPCLWLHAMSIALGQSWDAAEYDALLAQARSVEPKFWGYETKRAHSLLPRWFGEDGDWEAFAEKTSARPEGLGIELYPRIIFNLRGYYENVFRETKASWPKTREGLEILLKKYPDSLGILSEAALLATMAEDQPMAKELFAKIGDRYLPSTFKKPERFEHFRHWAETGNW